LDQPNSQGGLAGPRRWCTAKRSGRGHRARDRRDGALTDGRTAIWSSLRARRWKGEDAGQRLGGRDSPGWRVTVGAAHMTAVNGDEGDDALQLGGVEGSETPPSI
jgi:hypothetical protein